MITKDTLWTWLIDKKIREVVNQIKEEEAKIATLSGKIEDAAPEVSVAT